MLRLIMRRGPTPGATYALDGDEITIGRGSKNSIVIRDNEVSREHCRLVRLAGDYEVYDLNSSNGTFVNGQRVVTPWLLESGVLIELGDSITLEYGLPAQDGQPLIETLPIVATIAHYSLRMVKGPGVGYVYPLDDKTISIGRDVGNDIVIQDPEVSRHHLRLHMTRGSYHAEDLRSTNGTFVNGELLKRSRCLEPNDLIQLGTMVQLQYLLRDENGEENDEETPVIHPPAIEYDKNDTISSLFRFDPNRRPVSPRTTGLEPGALRDHLLIVYSREDWEAIVAPLMDRLQDTRLNAWVDQYLTPGSDNWRVAVEQALTECWLMVLIASPVALNSPYVQLMYRHFVSADKPIIPLIRDNAQTLPSDLNRLRTIVYDPDTNPRSFHKLVFEIMQLRSQQ